MPCFGLGVYDRLVIHLHREERAMARKTVFVSDFTGKEIADPRWSASISVKYGDGRRGLVVADAHIDDAIVNSIIKAGRQQARRGRRPRAEASS